jgi:sulfite reductase (NADPH) hemoprotein beta-component
MNTMTENPPVKPSHNEELKAACPTLAGTIAATLADAAADHFSEDDCEYLKFHGIYQSDDRDLRKTAKKYIFLVRVRLPGGAASAGHYLTFDKLASQYGNNTLRITSRQTLQLHGVPKSGLGAVIRGIQAAEATTVAACGDVIRNVMAPPTPATSPWVEEVQADARRVSDALLPLAPAYHRVWQEGQPSNPADEAGKDFADPLYGTTYLPRKFKIGFAVPPLNDVDIFTHCCGFVAIAEGEKLVGYNLLAGGGLGMSHGNAATYPRLSDGIGFLPRERVVEAARAVLTIHRDFGDRTNRRHARLKYLIQEKGVEWFRSQLNERMEFELEPMRPYQFSKQGDLFGWHRQWDGNYFLGIYVENGRIKDSDHCRLKTALRTVTERFKNEIRLTPSQNLLLVNVKFADCEPITQILSQHGVPVENQATVIRRAAMVCPSLPTCGRALAEAERMFPNLLASIEQLLAETGLAEEEIVVRLTGCPNGCVRSRLAEIGLVGKAPDKYHLYLGGNQASTRLNQLFKESVRTEDIAGELRPLFMRYAGERRNAERFGDFCRRAVLNAPPLAPNIYDQGAPALTSRP